MVRKTDTASNSQAATTQAAFDEFQMKSKKNKKDAAIALHEHDVFIEKHMAAAREAMKHAKTNPQKAEEAKQSLLLVKTAEHEKRQIQKSLASMETMELKMKATQLTINSSSVLQSAAKLQALQTQQVDPVKMEKLSEVMDRNYHRLKTTEGTIKNTANGFLERAMDELMEKEAPLDNDAISDADLLQLLDNPAYNSPVSKGKEYSEVKKAEWERILEEAETE